MDFTVKIYWKYWRRLPSHSVSDTAECLYIVLDKKVISCLCSEIMSLCLAVDSKCFFCRSDLRRFLNCQFHPLWLSLVLLWILMAQSHPCLQWAQSKKSLQKNKQKKNMNALLWLHKMYKHILKSQPACKRGSLSFCALKPYYTNDIKVWQSMLNTPSCKCKERLNERSWKVWGILSVI